MLKSYFITGTDTDCGKTYVMVALLDYLRQQNRVARGLKPVASGCEVINGQQNKNVVLEVQDNGPGIAPQFRARVFERFFRVLGNKTTGSGLGLAIVQQIVSLHHAHIMLDNPETETGLIVRVFFHLKPRVTPETLKKRDKQ